MRFLSKKILLVFVISLSCTPQARAAGWSLMDTPTTETLYGIWGTSATDVFAVGSEGTILHYDGAEWSATDVGEHIFLYGVWGSAADNVFAVGFDTQNREGVLLQYKGGGIDQTAWERVSLGHIYRLKGVWGSSASDVFAVGDNSTILHYDGDSWSMMSKGGPHWLKSVWGSSATNVYAVGDNGTMLQYDGSAWADISNRAYGSMMCVWGSSATDVFAGGWHYDGTTWASPDNSSDFFFTALWGSSPADIYGVSGYSGTILHYNGSTWSPLETVSATVILGIWGSSAEEVFAVGLLNGKILHYSIACSVKALPELIYSTRRTAPFVQKFTIAFDDVYPAKDSLLTWKAEAFKTLSVIKTGSKTATARVLIDPLLLKAGKTRFTFGDCSGFIWVDASDIDGTLWTFKDNSLNSDWYDREEVGFDGGTMYWRSTCKYVFDKVIGFSMASADIDGDRSYCGFLINPKSLKRPAMYIVWGRVNMSKPALTMKAIGIAGILPDFVRLDSKSTFLRKLETGWSPPLACPPVLKHWETGSRVGTFDGEKLWVLGYNLSRKPVLEGISNLEETDWFLPEPAVIVPLPDNQTIQGIAVDGDSIWYTEGFTERIYQITQAGELVTSFPAPGEPRGIFVQNGTVWYVAGQSKTVYKCDMSGYCENEISLFLEEPYGITFDGTHFWVSDYLYGKILYRIDMKGNIADLIYTPAEGGKIRKGQLLNPRSIALSGSSLWVFGGGSGLRDIYELDITALQELPAGPAAN